MTTKKELQTAFDDLWKRYGNTLSMLDDALGRLEKKPKTVEVVKEIVIEKEVPVEKIIEVEVIKEVPVIKKIDRIVEKEVPGPERIVEVPGPERIVEVPGPERIVERIVKVPGAERVVVRTDNSKIEELEQRLAVKPSVVEKANANNLIEAARIMSESEFNKEGYTEEEILNMLTKTSEEEVNRTLGFWAIPLPKDDNDKPDPDNLRYTTK